jgi:hypothetical protein
LTIVNRQLKIGIMLVTTSKIFNIQSQVVN